jgi:CHAT domain-containing protein/glutaminase
VPNSFSQTAEFICPISNKPFDFEVWLIIDRDERPDLIEKARAGTLNTVISPYTGTAMGTVDAPLLIFQPNGTPSLFFSPAQGTTQEQNQQQAIELIHQLRQRLGTGWQERWLQNGLPAIPRELVGDALDDFGWAAQKLAQTAQSGQTSDDPVNELRAIIKQLQQPPRDTHDMSRRVELSRRALELIPKAGNEQLRAFAQVELGSALLQNLLGSRAENLEDAIAAYQQALTVFTQTTMPIDWATTLVNLAIAYRNRIRGDWAQNLEDAIAAYQQALTVFTPTNMPALWANTMNNLANAYADRIRGERTDNLEQAIEAYQHSLTVRTRDAMPTEWAEAMMNLGNAYAIRIRGERTDNLEQAIEAYQHSLTVRTRDAMPTEWATTMMNLAIAYQQRIQGDRADNLEQAIEAYHHSLTVRTRDTMPTEWATTMMNLAIAYFIRIRGYRAENLEQAITIYHQVLTVFTQTAMPIDWARVKMNLANAYYSRIRGDRAQNLEDAIDAYQQALIIFTRSAMPIEWATTQMNLAIAYAVRIRGDRAENLELAIAAYQQALIIFTRSAMPVDWAQTMHNMADAFANRIRGNRVNNIKQAIAAYQQVLTITTLTAFPVEHRDTLVNLAKLYFREKSWLKAYQTCLNAITVGSLVFDDAIGDAGRLDAIKKISNLYIQATFSALQLGQYNEALTQLEAGKARLLAEVQSLGDANLIQLDDTERFQLQTLRDQIKALEYEARLPADNAARRDDRAISSELGEARAKLRRLIENFRAQYPNFMPEGLLLTDLLALIPKNSTLVAPLFTSQGSAVFVVPGDVGEVTAAHVLMLDNFKLDDLYAITRGIDEHPGWLRYYVNYLLGPVGAQALFNGIEDVTHRLWDAFVGKIHERLQSLGVKSVLLMPQADTALVPLHAAWREVDGVRRCLMEDYLITYTPSMVTLATARRKTKAGAGALVAGVSQYDMKNDLPNTRAEADSIAALFGTTALLDRAASVDAVHEGVRGKAYVHLSCHGGFDWSGNAFASALYLANDEPLPLAQIMAQFDLEAARLVVLSACETGIVDFNNVPDEFVGLPAGFMQAGASAVVSSLWTVEDRSTALLMERMYKLMLDKENPLEPAEALRQAQFWLRNATAKEIGDYYQAFLIQRVSQSEAANAFMEIMQRAKPDEKPYAHPFYWAAFTYNGL